MKEYLKRDEAKPEEKTWCRIGSDGKLEFLDWEFVAQQAVQFDQVGDAGFRDNIMTTCKIIMLAREQTLEKVGVLLERFRDARNDASAIMFYDPTATKLEPSTFVFMHVGSNVEWPIKLVDSIKTTNPQARIIMCTDKDTPDVPDVERHEFNIDRERIMLSRWDAFHKLGLEDPAIYMDSDMIVRGAIDAKRVLHDADYVFCNRSFNSEATFNPQQRGMDFSEYTDRSIGDVYPILACFMIVRSAKHFLPLIEQMECLEDKFIRWYGDQEVLRDFTREKMGKFTLVEESRFGCLPEYAGAHAPFILHYKGNRK